MDAFAKHTALVAALRNQPCDLELVSRLTKDDGTVVDVSHTRRAVCTKAVRRRNSTVLTFTDVDMDALERVFPFETFTTTDFPELFANHVGRRIAQGCGYVMKLPLTWIGKSGGQWTYAGPNLAGVAVANLLAVYRGDREGEGAVVSPGEYVAGATVARSMNATVATVVFAREQLDDKGRPYVIEADYLLTPVGGQTAAAELERILKLYGFTTDAASFAAASAEDIGRNLLLGSVYGGEKGRTGRAIANDLLQMCRGWLVPTAAGAWSLVQDVAKASTWTFDSSTDEIEIEDYGDGDIPQGLVVEYAPQLGLGGKYEVELPRRTTGGVSGGDKRVSLPYAPRLYTGPDYLASYWQKRLANLKEARVRVHAVQVTCGERITIVDQVWWKGAKDFIVTGITRGADSNRLRLREYVADVYNYAAGTFPPAVTNTYAPDYSYTDPVAPTGVAVVLPGTSVDSDGKTTAYATIRATPPAVNWARMMALVTDLTTNEEYFGEMRLNGGNYEAVIGGLRPGRNHNARAFAINSNNKSGAMGGPTAFTSATNGTVPAAPATVLVGQSVSFQLDVAWSAVVPAAGEPPIEKYVVEIRAGAGVFGVTFQGDALQCVVSGLTHGPSYQVRVYAVNRNQSSGPPTASGTLVLVPIFGTNHIAAGGVQNGNLGTGSVTNTTLGASAVTQGKISWAYTINNYLGLAAGATVGIGTPGVALCPTVRLTGGGSATGLTITGTPGGTVMGLRNDTAGALNVRVEEPVIL